MHRNPGVVSGLDRIELVPNIILNPGFCDSDDQEIFSTPFIKHYNIKYRPKAQPDAHGDNSSMEDEESEQSEIIPFKRRLSIFFTEGTIRRIWVQLKMGVIGHFCWS